MIDSQSDSGPVIVGVDGSERSVEALALADLLGLALGRRVVITHVHPFRQLSSLFAEGEYERLEREVAESTFEQIREYLPSVPERRLQLLAGDSPAAGLANVCFPVLRRPSWSPRPATPPPPQVSRQWRVASTVRRSRIAPSRGRPNSQGRHRRAYASQRLRAHPAGLRRARRRRAPDGVHQRSPAPAV